VGYADALVSMMSLQAALLVSFGDGEPDPRLMNGISGAAVFGTVSLIGIYMIYSSGRQKRNE
jgi:high-affinity Fe2+/Pb2+ permease